MSRKPSAAAAVGATLFAATLWGTSFSVNDYGLRFVEPATFVFLRFALAGVVTLAAAAIFRVLDARVVRRPWFWGLAAANAAGFLMQYLGQVHTTPARTALFVNTSAFFVAIMERAFVGVRLGAWRVLAVSVGFVGAALLVVRGDFAQLWSLRLVGDLLTLGAGVAWSVYMVMNREALGESHPLNVTAWTFTLTALLLVPALFLDAHPLAVPVVWPVIYAGLVTTALAYGLWSFGLQRISATASAVLLLAEILVASVVSFAIGRESFGPWDYAGAALLVAAVAIMSLVGAREQGEDAPAHA